MNLKSGIVLILIFMVCGCATLPVKTPDAYIARHKISDFTRSDFQLCYSYGCQEKIPAFLDKKDWNLVQSIFTPPPKNAQAERLLIAKAIQKMEKLTGEITGINKDIGGTFPGIFKKNQMDCEDEAVNTNIFFTLLQQDNLIRFHSFYGIARRGIFINGWPHVACAIMEKSSSNLFVVDSWFTDHGMQVFVLPEPIWKKGWKP